MSKSEYIKGLVASTESKEATVGKEREIVLYAEITDIEELKKAAVKIEKQEQWEIKSPLKNGRFRVRCSWQPNVRTAPKYVMCIKRPAGGLSSEEIEFEVSAEVFQAMDAMSPNGMIKTRYTVPYGDSEGVAWEFDVFEGTPYAKVDLELPEGLNLSPDQIAEGILAFGFVGDVITRNSPGGEQLVQSLYDNHYLKKKGIAE